MLRTNILKGGMRIRVAAGMMEALEEEMTDAMCNNSPQPLRDGRVVTANRVSDPMGKPLALSISTADRDRTSVNICESKITSVESPELKTVTCG